MVTAKCIGLSLGLLTLGTTLNGVVAQYTKEDKKIFDGLIDTSFTKSFLASKERKEKRIADLQQLATLMVRRLVNIMDGAGLKEKYNTSLVLENMRTAFVVSSAVKPDEEATGMLTTKELFGACRFATYDFEKNFEDKMESIFQKNLNNSKLEAKISRNEKVLLAGLKKMKNINLISFEYIMQGKPESKDLKKILVPTEEETINILNESLKQFNKNYEKTISALKQLKAQVALPDTMSLKWNLFTKQQPA